MLLADVVGTVVMSVKHASYAGEKLLQIQPLDEQLRPAGAVLVAVDRVQVGIGDRVLVLREGSGIRQILGRDQGKTIDEAIKMEVPIRTLIVGIVDAVEVG